MNSNTSPPSTVRKQTTSPATAWVQGLPSKPMSSEQQIEALRRVQVQAEQRVRLGNQLLSAAEARITANQQMLAEVRTQAERVQHETRQELAARLGAQDERFTEFENRLNRSMQALERKVDALRDDWTQMQVQLGRLLRQQGPATALPRQVDESASAAPHPAIAPIAEPVARQPAAAFAPPTDERPSSRLYGDLLQQLRHQADSEPEIEDQPAPPPAG